MRKYNLTAHTGEYSFSATLDGARDLLTWDELTSFLLKHVTNDENPDFTISISNQSSDRLVSNNSFADMTYDKEDILFAVKIVRETFEEAI